MNAIHYAVLCTMSAEPFVNQRLLAERSGHSLGAVNSALRALIAEGFLTDDFKLTDKASDALAERAPRNAIILAAGIGMRMAPVNLMQPKGMLEVQGEPLVERLVRQLHEVGITDITVVVGFMKERFDYLTDEYGVKLVVNRDYAARNNLRSLELAADRLSNTYIVPSDIWCAHNPFSEHEPYSWYMVSGVVDDESTVRVTRKGELATIGSRVAGNRMVGIAYLLEADSKRLGARLSAMATDEAYDDSFWEEALFGNSDVRVMAKLVAPSEVVEIDTYEQLRDLDEGSDQLKSEAIETIERELGVDAEDIVDIVALKKGMTNRSFLFTANGEKYIMRIPGEGTDQLINRAQEADVYHAIAGLGLCDNPVYINPDNGYKITRYLEGVRVCDADSTPDLERCMARLKEFHNMHLVVPHTFDIFERIDFYESLWNGQPSEYRDYPKTKAGVLSLKRWVELQPREWCLTHIYAVPDNFLFYPDGKGGEALQLTDWEYAGMQDPHVDVAMFCIYVMYDKAQTDRLIDIYFADEGGCDDATRAKIYCYVAMCGLLWSNWCEYKRNLGVEFGEYSLAQYRYAKDFRRFAVELMPEIEGGETR